MPPSSKGCCQYGKEGTATGPIWLMVPTGKEKEKSKFSLLFTFPLFPLSGTPASGMAPLTFSVGLLCLIKTLLKKPSQISQICVFCVILNPLELNVEISHHVPLDS